MRPRIAAVQNADHAAFALLVGLAARDEDFQAIRPVFDVLEGDAANSERRKPPAKPMSSNAPSRSPRGRDGEGATMC